jgi:ATPase subunit of ABC transporter with duplicated ATPase domains
MLVISSLAKSYGPQTLFEGVTLQLNRGCRYGLVGANGSGKSTFLKILMGDEPSSEGKINLPRGTRVGVLRQDQFADEDERIIDVAMQGDERVWEALAEREQLLAAGEVDAERLSALDERIAINDGYTLEARSARILTGLGVPEAQLREPLRVLSGGFRLRVLLGRVLIGNPDVLLLDEPTNHLDILSIRWLEQFLGGYEGCAVVISHDHRFLEKVCTHVLDVDYQTITPYTGSYQSFIEQKQLYRTQKEAEVARLQKILDDKMAFVERFRAKATKARQAQSRVKQIEKIDVPELAQSSRRAPNFRFEQYRPSGKDVLEIEGIAKSFGERRVLSGVGLAVRRGERVAVIGANGLGKSTLLKVLTDRLVPDAGTVKWGHETRIGYFAQDHRDLLTDGKTPLEFVWDVCPTEGTAFVRGQLGRMLFSGDEVEKSVAALSGGECARLIFCRMMIEKPNVLVLDEPTNHLDIEGIEALVEALLRFEGTLIFVSHDRWFVSRLATRIVDVRKEGIADFRGTFDEYLAHQGEDHLDAEAIRLRAQKEKRLEKAEAQDDLSWEERKRRQNRLKALPQKRDQLLEQIAEIETKLRELESAYCDPGFFERTSPERVAELKREEAAHKASVERLTNEWERVEEELASLEA